MEEIALEYKAEIWQIVIQYAFIFVNPFCSLGIVWMLGRMLGIFKRDLAKNILAILAVVGLHIWYQWEFAQLHAIQLVIYSTLSILIYVAFCWRLYYRLDAWQDKKIADDKKYKPTKKGKKK